MLQKFSRSLQLVKASASVLRSDKELLVFPVLSGIVALIVMATFALPAFLLDLFSGSKVVAAITGFVFYFCQYSIIFFFNSALVAAAMIRLNGGDPTISDGLNAAKSRLGSILGYAAIAATVGLILQMMKDKDNNFIVRLIGSALGAAWTLSTFLVVPVLVSQNVGPIDAIKSSIGLMKKTWGENVIGQMGIGFVFGLILTLVIVVGVALTVLAYMASPYLGITVGVFAVLAAVFVTIFQSALGGVYSAALYRYATDGVAPQGFESMDLQTAFAAK